MPPSIRLPSGVYTAIRPVLAVLIMGFAFFYLAGSYRILDVTLVNITDAPNAKPVPISLQSYYESAYSFKRVPKGKHKSYKFSVHTIGYRPQQLIWHVIPDDCITAIYVNSRKIPLNQFSKKELCDIDHGTLINLGPYVRSGHNVIDFIVTDYKGGTYKLHITPVNTFYGIDSYKIIDAVFVMFAWGIGWILYRLRFDAVTIAISILAFYMYLWDFRTIPTHHYAPDWWGHIEYIEYFRKNWLPPPADLGWETYHPPLYYYMAHFVGTVSGALGFDYLRSARIISLLSILVFNLFAMLTMRRLIKNPWLLKLCISAILFWPIMHSMVHRITNEVMSYPFWAAAYYFLLRWYQERQIKYMAISIILCGLMTLVKTTSIVPLGTIGVIGLIELLRKRIRLSDYLYNKKIHTALLVLFVCFGIVFGRTYYYKTHNPRMNVIIGNLHKDPFLHVIRVPATFYNMLYVDIEDLKRNPFVAIFSHREDRHLFWNAYIKTSLWGWFGWPHGWLATRLNVSLALLYGFAIFAPLFVRKFDDKHIFIYTAFAIGLAAHITNRIISMSTVTHEGRMTFPIIIMMIAWIGYTIESLHARNKSLISATGLIFLILFTSLAIWYGILFTKLDKLMMSLL